jgi:hypothetical protein
MCRTSDRVTIDPAMRNRSSHVFAVGLYAVELPADPENRNRTGHNFSGSDISLGQIMLATDFDLHNRNIVLSAAFDRSKTGVFWISHRNRERKTINENYLSMPNRVDGFDSDDRG